MAEATNDFSEVRPSSLVSRRGSPIKRRGDRAILCLTIAFACLTVAVLGFAILRSRSGHHPAIAAERQAVQATGHFRAVRVIDGDTMRIVGSDNVELTLRLAGVDAPERDQPYGNTATGALEAIVRDEHLTLVDIGRDKYGRVLANCFIGNEWIELELVQQGFAWAYPEFAEAELVGAENKARAAGEGLWAADSPIPPWKWRKGER